MGVHGVLEGHSPIHGPISYTVKDLTFFFEKLFGYVLLDRRRFRISGPDKDHAFQGLGGVFPSLDLAGDAGVWALAQDRDTLALAVKDPTVIGAGYRPFEMAVALGQASSPVGADIREGGDFAFVVAEET
jgi:hypothetical protein